MSLVPQHLLQLLLHQPDMKSAEHLPQLACSDRNKRDSGDQILVPHLTSWTPFVFSHLPGDHDTITPLSNREGEGFNEFKMMLPGWQCSASTCPWAVKNGKGSCAQKW